MAQMSPGNTPVTPNLASLIAAEAALARNADNLTSGTVAAARVGDLSATYALASEPIAAAIPDPIAMALIFGGVF